MKLNPDCIRAVMLKIEELHQISVDDEGGVSIESMDVEDLYNALPDFSKADIFYSLFNLNQGGYVEAFSIDAGDEILVYGVRYMTYAGHEFLDKIRDPERWTKVKAVTSAARSFALDAINQAANGIASAAITTLVEKYGP